MLLRRPAAPQIAEPESPQPFRLQLARFRLFTATPFASLSQHPKVAAIILAP